jgi:hypothetical protein
MPSTNMHLNADLIKFESDSGVSCAWSLSDSESKSESDDSSADDEEEEEEEEDVEEAPLVFGPRSMDFLDLTHQLIISLKNYATTSTSTSARHDRRRATTSPLPARAVASARSFSRCASRRGWRRRVS